MKKAIKKLFPGDYRHYICYAITIGFLAMGFLFPNALPRLGESFRDLATSILYYFSELLFPDKFDLYPTVRDFSKWKFADSPFEPISLFPYTWEEFSKLCGEFWSLFVNKENFLGFFQYLGNFLYYLSKWLL